MTDSHHTPFNSLLFSFDASRPRPDRILLFDVDGTLTAPRKKVTPDMVTFLAQLRTKVSQFN